MDLTLDSADLDRYEKANSQVALHGPYKALTEKLLSNVLRNLQEPVDTPKDVIWSQEDISPTETESYEHVSNLVHLWTPIPTNEHPDWAVVKHLVEMKHNKKPTGPSFFKHFKASSLYLQRDNQTAEPRRCKYLPRRLVPASCEGIVTTRTGKKRTIEEAAIGDVDEDWDSDSELEPPVKKRARLDKIVRNRYAQVAFNAVECLAAMSRFHVSGLLVDQWNVTPWVIGLNDVVCASSFCFDSDPAKLALVLYAMNKCDRLHAGFDPRLQARPSEAAPKPNVERMGPVDSVIGSYFEYDKPASTPDESENTIPPMTCFKVTGVIRRPDALVGRGTAVYRVVSRLSSGSFSDAPSVLKLSWPLERFPPENEILAHLKNALPKKSFAHFPGLFFSVTFTPDDLSLPWKNLSTRNHGGRVLRVLASPYYNKLWEAGSIENFKKAWLDCLEFHYLAFKVGKVLHRDLSENNLMVLLQCPDGTVNGILNDWDMAEFVDATVNGVAVTDHHIGTPAFMAFDLLYGAAKVHYFRHDLESFFYILVWAAFHYNLEARTKDEVPHEQVAKWLGTKEDIVASKRQLMEDNDVVDHVKEEWKGVLEEWIKPLRALLSNAKHDGTKDKVGGVDTWTLKVERFCLGSKKETLSRVS
ncbi:hypothetical protein DFP72DRAFT_857003 [Ephemerocybe angulata]|uniref:Fungal-type protein kinase domain-containing protein n=1 Tax=Ephemerocybe angulata TaxID=980116 RepID=A0A8H6HD20_9AGAR|nr:hypothetical protein DFP72DRAFT_857003 [Tulosesus angulatus]